MRKQARKYKPQPGGAECFLTLTFTSFSAKVLGNRLVINCIC